MILKEFLKTKHQKTSNSHIITNILSHFKIAKRLHETEALFFNSTVGIAGWRHLDFDKIYGICLSEIRVIFYVLIISIHFITLLKTFLARSSVSLELVICPFLYDLQQWSHWTSIYSSEFRPDNI